MWSLYRIEHLGLNVVLQLLVGVPLEMVHGATRIGLVYLAGVVAGRQVGPLSIGVNLPMAAGGPRDQARPQLPEDPHHQAPDYQGCPPGKPPHLPGEPVTAKREACDRKGRGRTQDLEQAD